MKSVLFIILLFPLFLFAQKNQYQASVVAKVNGVAWGFCFLNKDEILVTERSGVLNHINLKSKQVTKLKGPSVEARGQGGLLDVICKPLSGKLVVYLTYSKKTKSIYTTALAKGEFKDKNGG